MQTKILLGYGNVLKWSFSYSIYSFNDLYSLRIPKPKDSNLRTQPKDSKN